MARDLNKVQLTGRLGSDPTMRYTAHGSAIATFRVASNRTWRSSTGASHEDTEWFRIVAWDQLAERCRSELGRGDHIYVEGRLQTRQWVEADGQQRASTEVVASEVIMLGPSRGHRAAAHRPPRTRPAAPPPGLEGDQPPIALSEEDLPI